MKRSKRAQFFLLAAIIITAIVISLGIIANQAKTITPAENIYDNSFSIKEESGAVIDYTIYSGFNSDDNLANFVNLTAKDLNDRYPDSNFLFIYGNSSKIVLSNYGNERVLTSKGTVPGENENIQSSVSFGKSWINISEPAELYGHHDLITQSEIDVELNGYNFSFPFSNNKQVIFIIQKAENNESYISVN